LRHGDRERVDEWYWLRDRDDPAVLTYLQEENDYVQHALAHLEPLRARLFDEIKGRVRETDVSAPVRWGEWEYFNRTLAGREYPVHCRRAAGTDAPLDPDAAPGSTAGEQVLLDQNEVAGASSYYALRGFELSPNHELLAYSSDFTGGELAVLRVRDLTTAEHLEDEITDVYYGLAWASDNRTLYYVRADAAMRPWQVWRHALGTPVDDDELVFQEDDERFFIDVGRARTGRYVIVTTASKLTTEVHVWDADDPKSSGRLIAAREDGLEYHVEHHVDADSRDRFFVLTNADGASNFKVMVVDTDQTARDRWSEVIAHREDARLIGVDAFAGHLVVSERSEALERIRVRRLADDDEHTIEMRDEVYAAWVGANPEFDSTALRYVYSSLVTPLTDVDYDVNTREATVVKQQEIAGYDASAFEARRLWATAHDGERVPISLVQPKDQPHDGSAALLLYGYGSYEHTIDPAFSSIRVSLLERGVSFAIAHVRGGGEMGRRWYEDGRLLHKRNTFTDFISCAEHLIEQGATSPRRLVARGGSAGGLLMGAIANLRPDLFRTVLAEVPFVDCLTTMLDASLPLTITEWDEWGNPAADDETYDYLASYSPYDNVTSQPYPAIFATAGLNDPRVQYWEPAKWVAKLRASTTGDAPIYLKTELGAGHHGPSGRYETWKDEAFVLAFVLDQVGITS
jgi:oligopeptidase B